MPYPDSRQSDQVYQGRMIILGTFFGFMLAWSAQFLSYPILLIPGCFLDPSLGTFWALVFLLSQFAWVNLFLVLLWAGVGWARYVVGALFFLLGWPYIIASMFEEAFGGPKLIYGSLCIVGALAMVLSLSIRTYLSDRRQKRVPWLSVGLAGSGTVLVLATVAGIDLLRTQSLLQTNRREAAEASEIMERFAKTFDPDVIEQVADKHLKQELYDADFPDECQSWRQRLGAFQSFEPTRPASLAALVLNPRNTNSITWNAKGQYAKEDVFFHLLEDYSEGVGETDEFIFDVIPKSPKR